MSTRSADVNFSSGRPLTLDADEYGNVALTAVVPTPPGTAPVTVSALHAPTA